MTDKEDIAGGVAEGLNRERVRLLDRRLLILYLIGVLLIAGTAYYNKYQTDKVDRAVQSVQHVLQAVRDNCETINKGNQAFNKVLDQQITNVRNSTTLSDTQRQEAIATYTLAHLAIVDCTSLIPR